MFIKVEIFYMGTVLLIISATKKIQVQVYLNEDTEKKNKIIWV